MADEVEQVVEEVVEPVVEAEVVEPVAEVHPLAEGGSRFNEVYARMKQAEERAARHEGELSALRQQQQLRQTPPPQQYTPEQVADFLQQQVDRGQITPMQAANTMSNFNAQRIATQTAIQVEQTRALNNQQQEASREVMQYIDKVPALKDTNSSDFQRVSDAAHRVSARMGLPVTDLRVQQTALENVYGSLDRIAKAGVAREASRNSSLPHVETDAAGGRSAPVAKADDALKGISQKYIEFWTKKGYTRERMIEEAKYVDREPRTVRVNR